MRDQDSFLQGPGAGPGEGWGFSGGGGNQRGDMGGVRVSAGERGGDRWQRVWRVKQASERGEAGGQESGSIAAGSRQGAGATGGGGRGLRWPKWGLVGGRDTEAAPTGSAVAGPTSGGEGRGGQQQHRGSPEGSAVSSRSQLLCIQTRAHRLPCGLWMGSGPR